MPRLLRTALLFLLTCAVHALAQSRVCIGGDLNHLSVAQKLGCTQSARLIRGGVAKFHAPEDWRYFVICTESDWKAYAAFSKRSAAELENMGADTDLQRRMTFFRGEWLRNANAFPSAPAPKLDRLDRLDRMLAREVASAILQSADKVAIQKQVERWMLRSDEIAGVLTASR